MQQDYAYNNSKNGAGVIYQYSDGKFLQESIQYEKGKEHTDGDKSKEDNSHKSTRYVHVVIGNNGIARMEVSDMQVETDKILPELYRDRKECCGCTACASSCGRGAITMQSDEEGFLYPVVDAMKCVRCYRCMDVCAFKKRCEQQSK